MNNAVRGLPSLALLAFFLASTESWVLGNTVRYDLSAVDSTGMPVSSVSVGSTFTLHVDVTDLRPSASGVFAGFLDIGFPGLVTPVADSVVHAAPYEDVTNATLGSSWIYNAGGVANGVTPLGAETRRLFSIDVLALQEGVATFAPKTARDATPHDETLVYGENFAVSESEQQFVTTTITVVPEPAGAVLLLLGVLSFVGRHRSDCRHCTLR